MPISNAKVPPQEPHKVPPDVTPIEVDDVLAVEVARYGAERPTAEWFLAYCAESVKGHCTVVRICGHNKTTKVKELGGQVWSINATRQESARALASTLRPLDNKWSSREDLLAAIVAVGKLAAAAVLVQDAAKVREHAASAPAT